MGNLTEPYISLLKKKKKELKFSYTAPFDTFIQASWISPEMLTAVSVDDSNIAMSADSISFTARRDPSPRQGDVNIIALRDLNPRGFRNGDIGLYHNTYYVFQNEWRRLTSAEDSIRPVNYEREITQRWRDTTFREHIDNGRIRIDPSIGQNMIAEMNSFQLRDPRTIAQRFPEEGFTRRRSVTGRIIE